MVANEKLPGMNTQISLLQTEIKEWHNRNFGVAPAVMQVANLVEEFSEFVTAITAIGNLARALAKQNDKIRGTSEQWQEVARKEAGDVFITLSTVCSLAGIDLSEAITERWKEIKCRDWVTNTQGHGLPES